MLAENALGDPATRALPVILPPGYDADSVRRYPVVYGLAGFTGRGACHAQRQRLAADAGRAAGRACMRRGCRPVIVVLPDCFTGFGGSQYLNSPATGRYEDYLTGEIVPYIDSRYRTVATRPVAACSASRAAATAR